MAHTKKRETGEPSCGVSKLNKKVIKKGFADMTNDFVCSVRIVEWIKGLVVRNMGLNVKWIL